MSQNLKIDIVSDVSCPWCIIGYQSLSAALNQLAPQISSEIAWHPFELNSTMSTEGEDLDEHLHKKYGSSKADMEQTRNMITGRGAALGFQFNFKKDGRIYNTFNAHRLLFWAKQFGKQTELKLALFGLYFTEGGDPSNIEQLLKVVEKVGLPVEDARHLMQSDELTKEVRAEQTKYLSMDISSVPTFIINDKFKITGGQPVETFVEMLNEIVAKETV
jgi:predicted DsbA family dithiol-disulfide isomerase